MTEDKFTPRPRGRRRRISPLEGKVDDSLFVERPMGNRAEIRWPLATIIATATNGQAVTLSLDGKKRDTVYGALGYALRVRGYMLHSRYKTGQDVMTVWAELIKPMGKNGTR